MGKDRESWKAACRRGVAAMLAVMVVMELGPARASPGDIFSIPAPGLGSDPPKAAELKDGDTTVATATGALTYSYPVSTPPGRLGMAPRLALSYSSQAPVYGGIAAGWNWNLSIPEIREDVSSQGRLRTHYPPIELGQADPRLDDRFVSSMAGGQRLVLVTEPGDTNAYQYRADHDSSFSRYERMKPSAGATFKWRVYSTDGAVRYFGDAAQTSGCTHISDGFAPLTREVDAYGNEILYTYEAGAADECRIAKIEWGQNSIANVASFAALTFSWEFPEPCGSRTRYPGQNIDYRTGVRIVTGASRLTRITATAFAPGGSPLTAEHTRQIDLGYHNLVTEQCSAQHAPFKELASITERAWGNDAPLVVLPVKTFAYYQATTTLLAPTGSSPHGTPWGNDGHTDVHRNNLAWGYRYEDERWPTIEAMLVDVDGDGLLDRLFNTSIADDDSISECTANWQKNLGPNPENQGHPLFSAPKGTIQLPRLKWRGNGAESPKPADSPFGAAHADRGGFKEGCALNGQVTAYRNSSEAFELCHDFDPATPQDRGCSAAADPLNHEKYCNALGKGTRCPPGGGGAGTINPDAAPYTTYLAYRWLDADSDGLIDIVAAIHGDIDVYDPERGNRAEYDGGEAPMPGVPGYGQWPACTEGGSICINAGPMTDGRSCNTAGCTTNWGLITNVVNSSASTHVPCDRLMAKTPTGTTGGGSPPPFSRAPYQRCQGKYPWLIYRNLGGGNFATSPTIKYQPVPLESDNGDSALFGPAISATNHGITDFDGDGVLDAVVRIEDSYGSDDNQNPNDPNQPGPGHPAAPMWNVFLGDRTGQIGPQVFYFPTRDHAKNFISSIGTMGGPFAESAAGLLDFNGDNIPDHWYGDVQGGANIAFHVGIEQLVTGSPQVGTLETATKPGSDTDFMGTDPGWHYPLPIRKGTGQMRSRVLDVDNDGRPDVARWNGGAPQIFLNYGDQLSGAATYPGDSSTGVLAGLKRETRTDGTSPNDLLWELKSDLIDLDGDGIPEGAFFDTGGLQRAKPAAQPPRLLSVIDNGHGAVTSVTYASLHEVDGAGPVVEQDSEATNSAGHPRVSAHSQWVVKSLSTTDAFMPGTAVTGYRYKDPHFGPDDDGRWGFRGFDQITTTNPSGARTIQRYSFTPDLTGRLAATVVMPSLGSEEPSRLRRAQAVRGIRDE